ncbi:nucleotide disphospho-sugar-binding domain-containing protein [Saccharopolyspora sp. MS10]|uniref:nucleotide disphospho-sugar-binding domain-containing protein n=1 Tax=Saccharopolyspora sp. MS10 TaxID=3385973 RepID=UPI0039A20AC4
MRVLFAVSAWPGHYFPMVPLGWALRAAGHEVRVLCAKSDVDPVTRAGLTPVPVLDGLDLLVGARMINLIGAYRGNWPYPAPPLHPETGEPLDLAGFDFGAWHEGIRPELLDRATRSTDAAAAFARDWRPHLVVHDMMSLEGPLVARVTGVPDVLQLWGPVGTGDDYSPVGGAAKAEPAVPVDTSGAFARHGVGEMGFHHVDHVLDPCPAAIRPTSREHRVPVRYLPYNGPGAAPLDLPPRTGRPRVCVVWGRSATRTFGPVVNKMPQVVRAATALGSEVLLLASPADARECGPLPESVHVRTDLPLSLVLPGCDAVVHYGGGGATMTSVVAGVPQLALPCGFDQTAMAERITAAGAGLDLPNWAADEESTTAALERLVSEPAFAKSAAELATASAELPAPAEVVPALARLAA